MSINQNEQPKKAFWFGFDLNLSIILGIVLLLALALRIYDLGAESYWIDEIATVFEAKQSIHQLLNSGRLDQPIGYYIPFRFWMQTFGSSEVSTRAFSVLAGLGSTVLIFLIGRELFGKEVGLISAFLMAISTFQIRYSQETRNYSFFEFTTLLSFTFFISALKNRRMTYFILYAAISALMVYSNIFGLFILGAQAVFFILQIKKYKKLLLFGVISQILILIAILPFHYPLVFGEGGMQGAVVKNIPGFSAPTIGDFFRTLYRFVLPYRGERSWSDIFVNYAVAGAVFLAGVLVHALAQRKGKFFTTLRGLVGGLREVPDATSKLILISCWLLFPIIPPLIYSIISTPIYKDNYMIGAAPALYLMIAFILFNVRRIIPILVSIVTIAIMVAPGLNYYYASDVKQQWKEVAEYITEKAEQNDVIVFAPNWGNIIQQRSFDWYYQKSFQACTLGDENGFMDTNDIEGDLIQCVSGKEHFWVIVSDQSEEVNHFAVFFQNPNPSYMQLVEEHQFIGDITVYLFELTMSDMDGLH